MLKWFVLNPGNDCYGGEPHSVNNIVCSNSKVVRVPQEEVENTTNSSPSSQVNANNGASTKDTKRKLPPVAVILKYECFSLLLLSCFF